MMSGELLPDGGYDSRLKTPSCATAACSRMKEVTIRWRARKVLGEHGSTTGSETALQDSFAEWVPQLIWKELHRNGRKDTAEKIRVARIDVVATIPGSNDLQWLHVIIRRPTALTNMEGSARLGGHAATQGEREKTKKHGNKNEVGPDTVKPISIELGGRMGPQTISVLQNLTTKLGRAQCGDGTQENENSLSKGH